MIIHSVCDEYFCKFCGRKSPKRNNLSRHERSCVNNPNRIFKDHHGWNKGLTKETSTIIANSAPKIANTLKGKPWNGCHTEEFKARLSKLSREKGFGGTIGSLKYNFKKKDSSVVKLQSSYELRYAQFLEDNDVKWIRPSKGIPWIDDNQVSHKYYPDFYLIDYDVYVDPKNDFLIEKDKRKIELVCKQNNIFVKILSVEELNWLPFRSIV